MRSNGDWSESLVTNETNNFDTTGTVYSDTTSLNSISTSSRTGTEFHQLVDFTAASSAHTVVTTSSDMDFSGATGQEMVVSGTINVDSQVDNLVATTSLSSDVTINTMRVSGEYSDGVQALLPADWQGILGTIDTLGGAAVDWDWLGGGTVSALLLDMAITDYSSTENDFSSISPLTPPATPVSTYGTEMEFFVDGSIRFTSTGDSAWINGFSGTSGLRHQNGLRQGNGSRRRYARLDVQRNDQQRLVQSQRDFFQFRSRERDRYFHA